MLLRLSSCISSAGNLLLFLLGIRELSRCFFDPIGAVDESRGLGFFFFFGVWFSDELRVSVCVF